MRPEEALTASGCRLYRYAGRGQAPGTVVLAHGMFSNHRSLRGLAERLASAGFDAWTFDFRGHGASAPAAKGEDFESVCLADVRAVLDEVQRRGGSSKVVWVGHSGGGLAILMYLARHPEEQRRIERIAMLAAQATAACESHVNRLKVVSILVAIALLGRAPGRRFGLGPESETRPVMRQWCWWNLTARWTGEDGFDYLAALERIAVPSLALAGAADRFIAPASGCREIHRALGGSDRTFVLCGPGEGFRESYGHVRIACSRAAAAEVWPLLVEWARGKSVSTSAPTLR